MGGFGKALLVSLLLLVSYLTLLGVITVANDFGVETSWIRDPERVFDARVMVVVLAILLLPMALIGAATKWLLRCSPCFCHELREFSMICKGIAVGVAAKAIVLLVAVGHSGNSSLSFAVGTMSVATWIPYFGWFLVTLLLNSLSEEYVYRVFPVEVLRCDSGLPQWIVVVVAAAIFSSVHFLLEPPDLLRFGYRFSFGLAAGFLYLRHRSIARVVGLHTGWNFVALAFSDSDWRMGGIVGVNGLETNVEMLGNIAILFALAAVTMRGWWIMAGVREADGGGGLCPVDPLSQG